eukprot:6178262-Pleurochrysis_carterae.AAC.4
MLKLALGIRSRTGRAGNTPSTPLTDRQPHRLPGMCRSGSLPFPSHSRLDAAGLANVILQVNMDFFAKKLILAQMHESCKASSGSRRLE